MVHKQFKSTAEQSSPKFEPQLNTFKMIEAMGLKIIVSRSP
jgi:aspartate carbamoyltransferase catalytic subunit